MTSRHSLASAAATLAAALVCFFLFDALIFRAGPYTRFLEPDSSTGLFEQILRREELAQKTGANNLVLTLGDSRLGYYPRVSAEISNTTGIKLRNGGVAGSSPRAWFYMLRDLDPTARRYRAIVIAVNEFADTDEGFNPAEDLRSVRYVAARLRLSDIPQFTASFQSPQARWQAFRDSTFRGLAFQQDVLAFLASPSKRIATVNQADQGFPLWSWDFIESKTTMSGVAIDWAARKAVFPASMDQGQRDTINNFTLRAPAPQSGSLAQYRRAWFGRIIDRYRGSPTKVIFISLARGPYVNPAAPSAPAGVIAAFARNSGAKNPGVLMAGEDSFRSLERPELYRDGLHLNDEGCRLFSILLSQETARLLGTAPGATPRTN